MSERVESHMYLTGFDGGPCPGCGYRGRLWEIHSYIDERTRVIVHGDTMDATVSCTLPLEGMLRTPPDGTWSYNTDWGWD